MFRVLTIFAQQFYSMNMKLGLQVYWKKFKGFVSNGHQLNEPKGFSGGLGQQSLMLYLV